MKKVVLCALIFTMSFILLSDHVFARPLPGDPSPIPTGSGSIERHEFGSAKCQTTSGQDGVWVSIGVNVQGSIEHCFATKGDRVSNNVIVLYLIGIIQFLILGAGILAVGGVAWGGISYSMAQGNPGKIQQAVTKIIGSVVGLVLLFLLYALFNFIIPGQIFK